MASQFALRVKSLVWTDERASVSNEVMSQSPLFSSRAERR